MRLFLAIYPPKEVLDELRDALRHFSKFKRNIKMVPVDQFHVTVKYIGGKVSNGSMEEVAEALISNKLNFKPVKLQPTKLQFGFNTDNFPRVLMVNIEESRELDELSQTTHDIVKSLKLKDTIRFKVRNYDDYHITLARLKQTGNRSMGKQIKNFINTIPTQSFTPFKATEMFLVESLHKDGIVKYRKLERIELKASED